MILLYTIIDVFDVCLKYMFTLQATLLVNTIECVRDNAFALGPIAE
jgi:hypothetical protein